jgi:hypothetical protein
VHTELDRQVRVFQLWTEGVPTALKWNDGIIGSIRGILQFASVIISKIARRINNSIIAGVGRGYSDKGLFALDLPAAETFDGWWA